MLLSRVVELLHRAGGTPLSSRQIASALDVAPDHVENVLSTHGHRFLSVPYAGIKAWRLRAASTATHFRDVQTARRRDHDKEPLELPPLFSGLYRSASDAAGLH